jgi:hypothetical protein
MPSYRPFRIMTGAAAAVVLVAVPLPAQEPSAPALATRAGAMVRELSNLKARQFSHRARAGRFAWSGDRSRGDSLVVLRIVEAGPDGWSAIALHRLDPALRCAVVIGAAARLLNAVEADEQPFCLGEGDTPPPIASPSPDRSWLFWSWDSSLSSPPTQLRCPPLGMPRAPETNDSVYAEFVVGVDGRVEPDDIAIESTGGLYATAGMLRRLEACRFRAGTVGGKNVRTLMRHRIGLAPDRPPRPRSPVGGPAPTPWQWSAQRARRIMRTALDSLVGAQTRYHDSIGAYAASVAELGTAHTVDAALLHVTMLTWSATAWSAVAMHDNSTDRCFTGGGADAADERTFCLSEDGSRLPAGPGRDALVVPPQPADCNTRVQFRDDPHRRRRVVLEFVIGADGLPEPRTLRVLESTGLIDAAGAIELMVPCRYVPGMIGGLPARVLVRQPVHFN